jgi:hypothetical protein
VSSSLDLNSILAKDKKIGRIDMDNRDEEQRVPDQIGDLMVAFGIGKVRSWFALLFPPLLLYWFSTSTKTSSIYSSYEVYSFCGVCWLLLIIWLILLIYLLLVILVARALYYIYSEKTPLKRDSIFVKLAFYADRLNGPIISISWLFIIIFGYSWSLNYYPLKPIIMKIFSYFSMIYFIDYYQLAEIGNSYVFLAIGFFKNIFGL